MTKTTTPKNQKGDKTRARRDAARKPIRKTNAAFALFTHNRFLDWQRTLGRRGTVTEWAQEVLHHDRDIVNQWLNGRHKPSDPAVIRKLAVALGPEVYDALGHERPDPLQDAIVANWGELSSDDLAEIRRIVERVGFRVTAYPAHGTMAVHDRGRKA